MADPASKTCASCGRTITWRAKWADDWDDVRWCSAACRRRKVTAQDRDLERTITELLAGRARTATICPSEAARAVGGEHWHELMEPARAAARRLVAAGQVEITQGGRVVDPSTAKGPVRVRRSSAPSSSAITPEITGSGAGSGHPRGDDGWRG